MLTSRIAAVLVSLVAGATLSGSALADTANPLVNPGFEQGLTGWHPTNGTIKLAAPHSGKYSLQFKRGSQYAITTIQPAAIPLLHTNLDEMYSAGAWVYSPRAGQKLCIVITERDEHGVFVEQIASCRFTSARKWEHLHGQWASRTSGHSLSIGVQQWIPLAGDWYDVDDIELVGRSLPHNVTPPTISGDAVVGSTLRVDPGVWDNGPSTITYVWQLCWMGVCGFDHSTSDNTWTIPDLDFGRSVAVTVEVRNAAGLTSLVTPETAVIPEPT